MSLYQICGFLGFAVLIVSLLALIVLRPLGVHETFSRHAAQRRGLSLYYFAIFLVAMPLLWVFVQFHLVPRVGAPMLGYVFAGVALFQILCTLFPESGDRVKIHRLFAGISAALMLPFMVMLAVATSDVVCWAAVIVMSAVAIFALITRGRYALILQSVYYLSFFAGLFVG